MQQAYPDISGILSDKARRRLALAALSWEEKVAIIEQMQTLLPKGLWRDRSADERVPGQRHTARHQVAADAASRRQE
jgi:hypothetical protein